MSKARDLANAGTALTTVSATELGYLDGVTSAVQTQIDSKIGQATAINPTIVDAKGDLIAATAADTVSRLAVGSNDTVLTADSSTATGLKWAATSSPSYTWTSFTPTMSQNISVSVTNQGSAYAIVGDVVFVYLALSVTSTGSANEQVGVALTSPISSHADYGAYDIQCGVGNFYDYSANLRYPILAHFTGGTDIRFRYTGQNANVRFGQSGSGFTAAVGTDDQIRLNLTYRKA